MTGCVLTVFSSSSAGPSRTSAHKSKPSASLAVSKVSRTAGSDSKGAIIATDCDPCPGNANANVIMSSAPFHQGCAPGKAAAHCLDHDMLTGLDAAIPHGFVQRQRNGCRRSVGVSIHGHDDVIHGQAELAGGGFDDAQVGLMRYQPVDRRLLELVLGEQLFDGFLQYTHRESEYRVALHGHEGRAAHSSSADLSGDGQHLGIAAVGMQTTADNSRGFARSEHNGAGTVAEQNAGAAVAPVQNARIDFGADHQCVLALTRADKQIGNGERIHKAAAHRLYVEARKAARA